MFQKLLLTLQMIKIEHSVFALPFALISALVASGGFPAWNVIVWIIVAMVAARSCAMAFNRYADQGFDRENPRTKNWPLAAGRLSNRFVLLFILFFAALFVYAAFRLNPLAFWLSPVALFVIFFYSYTKRFTTLSHWFIGLALGIAPAGAWIAVRGTLEVAPIFLSFAILFWTAGFDLIYSCQDVDFDRSKHLFSIPSRYGISNALIIAKLCHGLTVGFLLAFAKFAGMGWWFYAGIVLVSSMLIYEHSLISPADLSKVNQAFFTVNGFVGVLLLISTSLDLYLRAS